jgi:aflatoxin B1 aldehyde reductase
MMNLILGTMTFGEQVDEDDARIMVQEFIKRGYCEIDTAFVYNGGTTEKILGRILPSISRDKYKIATKVNPKVTGVLDAHAVKIQFSESLSRLGLSYVDTLYIHFPDEKTPIEVTLQALADLYAQGTFRELGLSNFPSWMVVDIWHLCQEKGWPVPTVYEGLYNAISRKAEPELFPALRKLDIRVNAFNPLAGGLLTGKYSNSNDLPTAGRFALRDSYKTRYWKKNLLTASENIASICKDHNIKPAHGAFRWIMYHSLIKANRGDGIIIGASSTHQLIENLEVASQGALPSEVCDAFDNAWKMAGNDSPEYFRLSAQ